MYVFVKERQMYQPSSEVYEIDRNDYGKYPNTIHECHNPLFVFNLCQDRAIFSRGCLLP
jgi:hypothetical protein